MYIRIQVPAWLVRFPGIAQRAVQAEGMIAVRQKPSPPDQVVARADANRQRLLDELYAGPARRRF